MAAELMLECAGGCQHKAQCAYGIWLFAAVTVGNQAPRKHFDLAAAALRCFGLLAITVHLMLMHQSHCPHTAGKSERVRKILSITGPPGPSGVPGGVPGGIFRHADSTPSAVCAAEERFLWSPTLSSCSPIWETRLSQLCPARQQLSFEPRSRRPGARDFQTGCTAIIPPVAWQRHHSRRADISFACDSLRNSCSDSGRVRDEANFSKLRAVRQCYQCPSRDSVACAGSPQCFMLRAGL